MFTLTETATFQTDAHCYIHIFDINDPGVEFVYDANYDVYV